VFNGVDPFGTSANAGTPRMQLEQGAAASQAVGPPNNPVEMSCAGRGFDGPTGLGAKLLALPPLALQTVAPDDSALSCLAASPAGLVCGDHACTYRELIDAAFGPTLAGDAENQFARIWGQAIAAYESVLIPDQTPLDVYLRGTTTALTDQQLLGMRMFTSTGLAGEPNVNCNRCHAGAELSDATLGFAAAKGLVNVDGGDQGFHNTGVRPTSALRSEDLGRASLGPNAVAFSVSGAAVDRGAFKTPQLRNVKLTAPYFHNGGKATLDSVVEFYGAGGDFTNPASQLHAFIVNPAQERALIDFLDNALTDCRVEHDRGPFDHPSIEIPNGPAVAAVGAGGTAPCP
jgi:cytochrome c peroxidase